MTTFHIVTLFPESIDPYLSASVIGKARERGTLAVRYYNPRDYQSNSRTRLDERPFGGGPGMVLRAEPFIRAIDAAKGRKKNVKILFLDRQGVQFTNTYARDLQEQYRHIIIIAGRYEGIDARVCDVFADDDVTHVSIGPFILTGGEIPALAIIDCVSRQVPGVLGDPESLEEGRTAGSSVYTRPPSFKYKRRTYSVPDVLLSGHHGRIEEWKKERNRNTDDVK